MVFKNLEAVNDVLVYLNNREITIASNTVILNKISHVFTEKPATIVTKQQIMGSRVNDAHA